MLASPLRRLFTNLIAEGNKRWNLELPLKAL